MTTTSRVETRPEPPAAVAYLANSYPSPVEPYVGEEIDELRGRGLRVLPCSVWRTKAVPSQTDSPNDKDRFVLTVACFQPCLVARAMWLFFSRFQELNELIQRALFAGNESFRLRTRAIAHTVLGAMLAEQLRGKNVRQITVHHGFMAAWIGMVAARLLHIPYTLTLHGSDLLLRPAFLDTKLQHCSLCLTISEFNRRYLLEHYPLVRCERVIVQRMGVYVPQMQLPPAAGRNGPFALLAVGRLHPVKDHAFLIRACAALKTSGRNIRCRIAGGGPEHRHLAALIRSLHLAGEVELLGHVSRNRLTELYREADLVVLTSQSEGIPLTLMEAMSLGRPVLAPEITGIPELVVDGKTGFLYKPGSISGFVERVEFLQQTSSALGPVRQAAYEHVDAHFNASKNLRHFGDAFLKTIPSFQDGAHADSLLQQVQL